MKQIKEWMDNKHREVRDRNGKVFMDLFEHDLFVGIPSETSKECERRSVNYPIQSLSSSLNGYFGYLLHKEASRQGILNYPLSFVHDAWIFEIPMKYLFNFLELVKYYFKTYPDQQIGLPADCDFDISVNKYMPKEITYELVDNPGEINKTTVKFKTKIVMIHKNRYLYESFLKNLPNCRITHEEVSEEILDSQKLSDLPNPKCSWGVHLGKPVKIVKIEGECDYIPLEKSSGYSNGLFQDDALHLNTTHLLSVVNRRNDNEIEE